MGKFYGRIGYAETVEEPEGSGIWIPRITERFYYGEIGRSSRRLQSTGQLNDDIIISNEISIIADKFAAVLTAAFVTIFFNNPMFSLLTAIR